VFESLLNAFRAPDIRRRILFVLGILIVYRLLAQVPLPGIDRAALAEFFRNNQAFGILDLFAGGGLSQLSIVGLALNPYINASIIMQLMTGVIPSLQALSREGEYGRQKLNQYTRYLTVPMALLQAFGILSAFAAQDVSIEAVRNGKAVEIKGTTQSRATLIARNDTNDTSVSGVAEADGTFTLSLPLASGTNHITITATDPAGNVGETEFRVRRGSGKLKVALGANDYQFRRRRHRHGSRCAHAPLFLELLHQASNLENGQPAELLHNCVHICHFCFLQLPLPKASGKLQPIAIGSDSVVVFVVGQPLRLPRQATRLPYKNLSY